MQEASLPLPARPLRIDRRSLHDQVVTGLRDLIIEGVLPPGGRIHEGQLCDKLGVSRTPLREALKVLAAEGLVELMPNRGALVRRPTPEEVRDTLVVIGALETLAAEFACRLATDAELSALAETHRLMLVHFRNHDRLEYFKLNQSIHSGIVRLSANRTLMATHDTLQARIKRVRFMGNDRDEEWRNSINEHEEMIQALQARDVTRLGAAMRLHMENAWNRVKGAL
jgi:DNA-binding GntR family transcriptional regulator